LSGHISFSGGGCGAQIQGGACKQHTTIYAPPAKARRARRGTVTATVSFKEAHMLHRRAHITCARPDSTAISAGRNPAKPTGPRARTVRSVHLRHGVSQTLRHNLITERARRKEAIGTKMSSVIVPTVMSRPSAAGALSIEIIARSFSYSMYMRYS
jgi:hypothetical protein